MMRAEMPTGGASRLLVINPNSNATITRQVAALAGRVLAGSRVSADAVDLPGAPLAIQSPADREVAEPLAIARIEQGAAAGYDGFVMACFDDIAVGARGCLPFPIVDAVDASLAIARTRARRIAIVTTFDAAVPRIRALVARHGLDGACRVRAAGIDVSAAADLAPETLARLHATIDAAIAEDGAGAIILGSGALAGRGPVLTEGRAVPVIDCIEAAISFAAAAMLPLRNGKLQGA